jgi:peptide deformylase
MTIKDILLIGDPRLYEISEPVRQEELPEIAPIVAQLGAVIKEFRATYGAGRAIAAPQLGIMKRLIVLNIDKPVAIINPVIYDYS